MIKPNKLLALLNDLEKQGNFDELYQTLDLYQDNQKLSSTVNYFRGHLAFDAINEEKDLEKAYEYFNNAYALDKEPHAAYYLSKKAEGENDINLANDLLFTSAASDFPPALNDLGVLYLTGRGYFKQNKKVAVELITRSAEYGYPYAQINFANYYILNTDDEVNINIGINYLAYWCEHGDYKEALYLYGYMLVTPFKVNANNELGIEYLKRASNLGHVKASALLGKCYYNGECVPVDHKTGLYYYEKAALAGDIDSSLFCSYAYLKGDGVEKNLQKSLDYCYKAAKGGNAEAQIALGDRYYYGDSVKQDYHVAIHWFNEAAKANSGYAYERMADMLLDGQGVKKDTKKALEFYNKALELGDKDVYLSLGKIYQRGLGVKRDKNKAFQYYLMGYKRHNPYAAFAYAELASSGRINGIKDFQNAAPAYEMAALADIPEACKKAGEYYLKGLGVVRDLEKALDYYLKASLLGDNESTIMVNIIKKQIDLNSI